MAITGQGTQDDPYKVHSYEELKIAIGRTSSSTISINGSPIPNDFIELEADIDCNDYGTSFVWNTIKNETNHTKSINLCGHKIKNVLIPSNNFMFDGTSGFYYSGNNYTYRAISIYNGSILNVYGTGAAGIITGPSYNLSHCEDISFSINADGFINTLFQSVILERCSFYYKSMTGAARAGSTLLIRAGSVGSNGNIIDCDFNIDFPINDSPSSQNLISGSSGCIIKNCRFTGCFKWNKKEYAIPNFTAQNCVLDIIVENTTSNWPFFYDQSGCLINKDKIFGTANYGGYIQCTSEEIVLSKALNNKGFIVIKEE